MRTAGTLSCWGNGASGRLGSGSTGSTGQQTSPVQVSVATSWSAVAAGDFHTSATQTGGTLWCWGSNTYVELGDGTYTQRTTAVQVPAATSTTLHSGSQASVTFFIV